MALPSADLVLRGGRVWTGAVHTGPEPTAVAVRDGRVLAVGSDDELAPLAQAASAVVDLEGRRVLPGLQDSHIHAVRAGLTWERELHWEEVRTLTDALAQVQDRARRTPSGTWISVVGGWHERQLAERRLPTREELDAAAPDHPVFVQMLYDAAVLNTAALRECGWDDASADPQRGRLERDGEGRLPGAVHGMGAYMHVLSRIPAPTLEEQRRGTGAMLAEFARHGVTAVVDGGGFLMTPESYHPLLSLWRDAEMPVRARLFVSAATSGREVDELTQWMRHTVPGFGDDVLRFSGLGEIVHHGCHDMEGLDPYEMSKDSYGQLVEISRLAARRGWPMSVHAVLDHTLGRVLDAWELTAAEHDIRRLRFSIVHADQASAKNVRRMADLGVGVLVQNRLGLKATDYVDSWGLEQTLRTPPIGEFVEAGLPMAAGSDATRANWYQPWASVWWLVTGGSVDGQSPRAAEHRLDVEAALRAYTGNGAWFTFEEGRRGRLVPGQLADLFVPTADPFDVEADALRGVRSELTVMAGRVTHSSGQLWEPSSPS
jgi:predicted amidohydrolase YtcJ